MMHENEGIENINKKLKVKYVLNKGIEEERIVIKPKVPVIVKNTDQDTKKTDEEHESLPLKTQNRS